MPFVSLAEEHSQQFGLALLPLVGKSWLRFRRLAHVLDHVSILHFDQAVRDHFIKGRQNFFHFLRRFHEFDPNGQMLGQHLDFGGVQHLVRAESRKGAGRRSARDSLVHEEAHDGIVQCGHMILGVFVDEDRDLLGRTLDQHTASSTGGR